MVQTVKIVKCSDYNLESTYKALKQIINNPGKNSEGINDFRKTLNNKGIRNKNPVKILPQKTRQTVSLKKAGLSVRVAVKKIQLQGSWKESRFIGGSGRFPYQGKKPIQPPLKGEVNTILLPAAAARDAFRVIAESPLGQFRSASAMKQGTPRGCRTSLASAGASQPFSSINSAMSHRRS